MEPEGKEGQQAVRFKGSERSQETEKESDKVREEWEK